MTVGEIVALTIEKPAAGGRMIARAGTQGGQGGQVVLVSGVIPGERVRARVERVSKRVVYAEAVNIEEPSPDRRDQGADPLCGGCLYGHIAYSRQIDIKRAVIRDAFARIGRLELPGGGDALPVTGSPEEGYRMRARLHVRAGRIGFFREGTHDICDARQTRQLLMPTCDAMDRLAAAVKSLRADTITEVDLAENVDASHRVVALETAAAIDRRIVDRLGAIEGFTGVASGTHVHGNPYVIDRLALHGHSVPLRRHVLAFFQGNRHLLPELVLHVVGQLADEGEVVDLYAGVGLFSVSAAIPRGVAVTAVEGDRAAAIDLEVNGRQAAPEVTVVHDAVERFVRRRLPVRPSAVIVDPPRTGMSPEALDGALSLGAPRLIYISCDVATLARDARRIVDAGFRIARADAFDLFPNTPHVETVVVFERA
jgi:23S rRNA (uracil1939-C5)-methyltransferase